MNCICNSNTTALLYAIINFKKSKSFLTMRKKYRKGIVKYTNFNYNIADILICNPCGGARTNYD